MAEREALWGRDLDDAPADDGDMPPGRDPTTEPIPLDRADSQSWDDRGERDTSYARPFIERLPGSPISALTFKPAPPPWYRTKPAIVVFIAAVAVGLVLAILPLVLRSPDVTPQQSTSVAPVPSTSTGPASSSAAPTPSGAQPSPTGAPAPPPPPPPPPAPAQDTAPTYSPYYPAPRNSSPSDDKPDVNVTRAPISVAPEVRAPPPDEAKVGEGRPRRGFW